VTGTFCPELPAFEFSNFRTYELSIFRPTQRPFDREIDPAFSPRTLPGIDAATRALLERWAPGVKHAEVESAICGGLHQRIQWLRRNRIAAPRHG
jgi:hypothetical protein